MRLSKEQLITVPSTLNYLSELRNRFIETLNLDDNSAIIPQDAHLLVAKGAALDSVNNSAISNEKLKAKIVK